MTPEIKKDDRIWKISCPSQKCPFRYYPGISECCRLLKESSDECTFENCPNKIGGIIKE